MFFPEVRHAAVFPGASANCAYGHLHVVECHEHFFNNGCMFKELLELDELTGAAQTKQEIHVVL